MHSVALRVALMGRATLFFQLRPAGSGFVAMLNVEVNQVIQNLDVRHSYARVLCQRIAD